MYRFLLISMLLTTGSACSDSSDSSDSSYFGEPDVVLNDHYNTGDITLHVTNHCSFDVEVGVTGGYAGHSVDGKCKKYQDEDGTGRCFWNLNIRDKFSPGDTQVIGLNKQENSEVVWSGMVFGIKSPLMKTSCPSGKCKSYQGPTGTVNMAEFTILKEGTTFYDISNIHGVSLPTSMGPSNPIVDKMDPYRDGTAGDCSWDFEPPAKYMKYLLQVSNSNGKCSKDSDCDGKEVCGTFLEGKLIHGTCGEFRGYTNAHTNCISGSSDSVFQCDKYTDLYGCSGKYFESGYSMIEGGEHICGCSDYDDLDIVSAFPCRNKNPLWEEKAYKWIKYLKEGCPSAFTFAYDDATSLFTSKETELSIDFCPGDSEYIFFRYD